MERKIRSGVSSTPPSSGRPSGTVDTGIEQNNDSAQRTVRSGESDRRAAPIRGFSSTRPRSAVSGAG
jgi:hypothetical protein